MATDQNYVDFVLGQIKDGGEICARKMFGEYSLYSDGKLFGLVCDNRLFIKPTGAGREFIGDAVESLPYEGAKPSLLIEDGIKDSGWLSELVRVPFSELPPPRRKRRTRD